MLVLSLVVVYNTTYLPLYNGCNIFQWKLSEVYLYIQHVYVPGYQVSGILISPGEPLANGYYKWHPEKKGKKVHVYTQNKLKKWTHKNGDVK